jgi:hypothetical protein
MRDAQHRVEAALRRIAQSTSTHCMTSAVEYHATISGALAKDISALTHILREEEGVFAQRKSDTEFVITISLARPTSYKQLRLDSIIASLPQ